MLTTSWKGGLLELEGRGMENRHQKNQTNARKPDQTRRPITRPGRDLIPQKKISPRKRAEQGNKEVAHTKTRAMSATAARRTLPGATAACGSQEPQRNPLSSATEHSLGSIHIFTSCTSSTTAVIDNARAHHAHHTLPRRSLLRCSPLHRVQLQPARYRREGRHWLLLARIGVCVGEAQACPS